MLHSLARNHALVEGNKRLAWPTMRTFLPLNGRDVTLSVDAAEALFVGAADGSLDVEAIAGLVREACVEL